jgi:predicted CXXCH cytochrome family protein
MDGATVGRVSNAEGDPYLLFSDHSNNLCYGGSETGGCHRDKPFNYPAQELDRMPEYSDWPGYFEYNDGSIKVSGVNHRKRWTGEQGFRNPLTFGEGEFYSPHANDQDMPLRDDTGEGMCMNCHEAHASGERPDLLTKEYGPISGAHELGWPSSYSLCLDCHSEEGPVGMDFESQRIRDYYDSSLNGDLRAGHQIRFNNRVALSWPSNVEIGDMLPCYDCHNPHGSLGNDGTNPNGFLISDERLGWSGLNNTLVDAEQSRRFCLGCHITSDGEPGSKVVEGIVMNSISGRKGHSSSSVESCHLCHGGDYSTSTSYNVHHPAGGVIAVEMERHINLE